MAVAADVTEEAPVKALFARRSPRMAGSTSWSTTWAAAQSGHIWEAKVEDWDFIMRLNLRSAFLCTREAAAHMRERRARAVSSI